MSKCGVFFGLYFPAFGLNSERYEVSLRIQSEYGKYGPEKTPYLDTFYAMELAKTFTEHCINIVEKSCEFEPEIVRYYRQPMVKGIVGSNKNHQSITKTERKIDEIAETIESDFKFQTIKKDQINDLIQNIYVKNSVGFGSILPKLANISTDFLTEILSCNRDMVNIS